MRLPQVSGKQTVEALLRAGFIIHRVRGSHYILKHPETSRKITIPYHRRGACSEDITLHLKAGRSQS